MKEKLNRAKTWYVEKFKQHPMETVTTTVTLVASAVGLYAKVSEASTNRSKAKTWKREVARREKKQKEDR